jgi:DNA-binding transcriptional LysR family regulator
MSEGDKKTTEKMANIRRLRHVVALGKFGSFALAADSVHLSQPAFSRSIQSIEDEYGVPLFVRGSRKVQPTPYGKIVIARAEKILQEVNGLKRDVDLMKAHEFGEVLVGMGPIPAAVLLIPVISRLAKQHPQIHTKVEITHSRNLLKLLNAEALDFFIADIRELNAGDRLDILPLPKLGLSCFCRVDHPLLSQPVVTAHDLLKFPLASFRFPDKSIVELITSLRYTGDPRLLWTVECDNLLVLAHIAATSDVITLGPEQALRAQKKDKSLVELTLDHPLGVSTHFGIVTLRDRMPSPAAELFLQYAVEQLESDMSPLNKGSARKA